jgi:stage V sporulation protein G
MQKLTNNQDGNKQGKVVIFVIVTDVRVRKVLAEGKMKAIVSVTLDDSFVIHDVKVVEGQNGLFVAMPSRKTPDGEFRDIAHPINTSANCTRSLIPVNSTESFESTALTVLPPPAYISITSVR